MSRGVDAEPDAEESHAGVTASAPAVDESLKTRTMDEAPVGITVADATEPDMPLVYVNAAFERITGYPPEYAVGRNCRFLQGEGTRNAPVAEMRAAIEAGEATTVELRNYRRDGELFWNEVTIAPLYDDDGAVTHYVGFQQDVTRRKRAERAAARRASRLDRERDTQERLLDRLDGVVVDVTRVVAEARSQASLERDVVTRLSETYAGARIGRYDPADEAIVPQADAGWMADDEGLDRIPVDAGFDDDPSPVAAAVSTAVDDRTVRIRPLADASTAVGVVPLHYGDAIYGVVCVYVRNSADFDDHERAVLTALGRTVATGINALESHRTLRADERIELQFSVVGDHPLRSVAAAADCRLEYAGSVGDRDHPADLFEVDGADADEARAATRTVPVDLHAALVEGEDDCLVELSVTAPSIRDLLVEYGAELHAATITPSVAEFTVEVGRESIARSLAAAVTDRFEGADLTRYRQRERRPETHTEFVARLEADLTDRQRAALVRAYAGGFFEWPHEATGDDIAEAMGVCRSTFHQHLRAAQRKVVGAMFDG
ncbi:bacterio-opsin activator domain-containing protein [Haloplanus salilacus]|uniref:bacterio-opsin activator domain-containing protein n=1 Tax=Haloplanus salilacus TaxID=2949994 RepID=UPI0030CB59DF